MASQRRSRLEEGSNTLGKKALKKLQSGKEIAEAKIKKVASYITGNPHLKELLQKPSKKQAKPDLLIPPTVLKEKRDIRRLRRQRRADEALSPAEKEALNPWTVLRNIDNVPLEDTHNAPRLTSIVEPTETKKVDYERLEITTRRKRVKPHLLKKVIHGAVIMATTGGVIAVNSAINARDERIKKYEQTSPQESQEEQFSTESKVFLDLAEKAKLYNRSLHAWNLTQVDGTPVDLRDVLTIKRLSSGAYELRVRKDSGYALMMLNAPTERAAALDTTSKYTSEPMDTARISITGEHDMYQKVYLQETSSLPGGDGFRTGVTYRQSSTWPLMEVVEKEPYQQLD